MSSQRSRPLGALVRCSLLALPVLAAPPAEAATRLIPITFFVNEGVRYQSGWRELLERAVRDAQELLGPGLGDARFAVADVVHWEPAAGSAQDLLDGLRTQAPPEARGIVAGIVGDAFWTTESRGLASFREGLLVVAARGRWDRLFAHELAHLFGAVHLPGENGLLAERDPGRELDGLNTRLISLHAARSFAPHAAPLSIEDAGRVLPLYEEARERGSSEAMLHIAEIALERGDPKGALAAADSLLERHRGDTEALNLRGIALRRLSRPDEAVAAYEEALRRRPRHAPLHYNLAIALDHTDERNRAAAAYQRAIELDPRHVLALSNLARLLSSRGDPARAIECADRALELAPDFAEARVNLAAALLAAGRPEAAEAEARRAAAERPDLASAHEALGGALLGQGLADAAAEAFAAAARLEPGEPRFREQMALALTELARRQRRDGETDAALATLRRVLAAAPDYIEALADQADLAFVLRMRPEAAATYRRLLALRPDDAVAHNNLAVVLFREGDVHAARRHALEAQRLGLAVHPDFLTALEQALDREP